MTITLDISPETEARINRQAKHDGLLFEDVVKRLLDYAPPEEPKPLMGNVSSEEFARALDEWIDSHDDWPELSEEATSKENIYGDYH